MRTRAPTEAPGATGAGHQPCCASWRGHAPGLVHQSAPGPGGVSSAKATARPRPRRPHATAVRHGPGPRLKVRMQPLPQPDGSATASCATGGSSEPVTRPFFKRVQRDACRARQRAVAYPGAHGGSQTPCFYGVFDRWSITDPQRSTQRLSGRAPCCATRIDGVASIRPLSCRKLVFNRSHEFLDRLPSAVYCRPSPGTSRRRWRRERAMSV